MDRIMGTFSFFVSAISILVLLFSVSRATSQPTTESFLQCLLQNSEAQNPVINSVYTPNNSTFTNILNFHIHNKRFKNSPLVPKPLAIVTAGCEAHVQAAITCAKGNGLQIRIRSGGHDYEGFSYVSTVPFIILDMFPLSNIDIDIESGTAWVQAGATLGQLYYRIQEKSQIHAFPAGVCTSLGTGGHFSGGGYGNLMRKYGLSVDNIIDAKFIGENGQILCRETMGEDLFWAIRGGGAASFGVVIAWKIKLVPMTPKVTVFNVTKTLEQGVTDVVYRWQEVVTELDEDLFIRAQPHVVGDDSNRTVAVSFFGEFLGQSDRLLGLMNHCFPELGLQKSDCIEMPWINSTLFWANFPTGTPIEVLLETPKEPITQYFKSKSDYVKQPIPKEGLEAIWKQLMMVEGEKMVLQWNPYGGKMAEIPACDTPFPHRAGNLFLIQYYLSWEEEGEGVIERYLNYSRSFYEVMTPYVSSSPREAFLNYRDRDIGASTSNGTTVDVARTYGTKFFRDNFDRLVQVKTNADSQNFFGYEQSIPPTTI